MTTTQLQARHLTARFTGKERDIESGLDYFGAGYYGSSLRRFMSRVGLFHWTDLGREACLAVECLWQGKILMTTQRE